MSHFNRRAIGIIKSSAIAELTLYFLLAVYSTWPLTAGLGTSVSLGTESAATVPMFTTWTIWWNADRAAQGYENYWDAPIFHPTSDVFAFSEPMPTTVVVAPIFWLSGNRLLAHNAFLLIALSLNGWSAFHLLKRVGTGRFVAVLGGGMVEFLPIVHHELGVLQLVPLFGIIWTIHWLYRFGRRNRAIFAVWLGAAFSFTYLTCTYYGLFLGLLLLVGAGWLLGRRVWNRRTWKFLPLAIAVSGVLLSPIIFAQFRVVNEHHLVRAKSHVDRLSAEPADYLATPTSRFVADDALRPYRQKPDFPLCPGFITSGLAISGACIGFRKKRFRGWSTFCVTSLIGALVLSMGPEFHLVGWSPYQTLMNYCPGFAQVRSVFRFAVFVQLMTVLLASLALYGIARMGRTIIECQHAKSTRKRNFRRPLRALAATVTATIAAIASCEAMPRRPAIYSPPAFETQRAWIEWLDSNTPQDCAVVHLPFPQQRNAASFQDTALWMYWGTFHRRKLLNGYSGFLPKAYLTTKESAKSFPDQRSIQRLRQQGAEFCIIHRSYLRRRDIESVPSTKRLLSWRFGDPVAEIDIYQLTKSTDDSAGRRPPILRTDAKID